MKPKTELSHFVRSYWNYFLELEEQLISTKRFVDFDKSNGKTFSIEYLKLLQATCSEIDVVAKIMAEYVDAAFKADRKTTIQKWGYILLKAHPEIEDTKVCFNKDYDIVPWTKWGYEEYRDKNDKIHIRLIKGKETPAWWTAYNKVKHERTSGYQGQTNYIRANQENLVSAMAALFVLESLFLSLIADEVAGSMITRSRLFVIE